MNHNLLENVLNQVVPSIKENEGFRALPYIDPIVRKELAISSPDSLHTIEKYLPALKLTVGYGSLINVSKKEATSMARHRLEKKFLRLVKVRPVVLELPLEVQVVLAEMVYQMGVTGVRKFKNMWKSLENHEFDDAAYHMTDSRWYRQTPSRAKKLSDRMALVS